LVAEQRPGLRWPAETHEMKILRTKTYRMKAHGMKTFRENIDAQLLTKLLRGKYPGVIL